MTEIKPCENCGSNHMSIWSVFPVLDEISVRFCCNSCGVCKEGFFDISDIKKWQISPESLKIIDLE